MVRWIEDYVMCGLSNCACFSESWSLVHEHNQVEAVSNLHLVAKTSGQLA